MYASLVESEIIGTYSEIRAEEDEDEDEDEHEDMFILNNF